MNKILNLALAAALTSMSAASHAKTISHGEHDSDGDFHAWGGHPRSVSGWVIGSNNSGDDGSDDHPRGKQSDHSDGGNGWTGDPGDSGNDESGHYTASVSSWTGASDYSDESDDDDSDDEESGDDESGDDSDEDADNGEFADCELGDDSSECELNDDLGDNEGEGGGNNVPVPTTPATVPVPAAIWLLVSGLAGLVGASRKKK